MYFQGGHNPACEILPSIVMSVFPTLRSYTYHKVRLSNLATRILQPPHLSKPYRQLPCNRSIHAGKGIHRGQPPNGTELPSVSPDGPGDVLTQPPSNTAVRNGSVKGPRDPLDTDCGRLPAKEDGLLPNAVRGESLSGSVEILQSVVDVDQQVTMDRGGIRPSAFHSVGSDPALAVMRGEVLQAEARSRADEEVIAELLQDGSISYGPRHAPLQMEQVWLRDMCSCDLCVNVSTKQKNFQTSDIPVDVKAKSIKVLHDESLEVTWRNDVPGWGEDHVSVYPRKYLEMYTDAKATAKDQFKHDLDVLWDGTRMTEDVLFMDYDNYMHTDVGLCQALNYLRAYGLIFIRGVPANPKAVEKLGERVGNLRDTFYGRTWDVKSVPQAKNVAYTHQFLGMHMDLLYMSNPPGFQLLHCLQNSCEGGSSLFSDGFHAARSLRKHSPIQFAKLAKSTMAYHYRNAGEHYHYQHKVIEMKPFPGRGKSLDGPIDFLNWSPPFQAPQYQPSGSRFSVMHEALSKLGQEIEKESNVFEYRLKEGECVIFNNRRVLHARRAFDVTSGHRWLKGAYVDTDAFMSRLRVMNHKLERFPETPEELLSGFPDSASQSEQASHEKKGEQLEDFLASEVPHNSQKKPRVPRIDYDDIDLKNLDKF